jgi:hypothetical protein
MGRVRSTSPSSRFSKLLAARYPFELHHHGFVTGEDQGVGFVDDGDVGVELFGDLVTNLLDLVKETMAEPTRNCRGR